VKLIDLRLQKKIYAFAMCHLEWWQWPNEFITPKILKLVWGVHVNYNIKVSL